MTEQQSINAIIGAKTPSEAVAALRLAIESAPENATSLLNAIAINPQASPDLLIEAGKQFWRFGKKGSAMSAYERAAILDPSGPAPLLLEHSNSIMDFFNPDLLNP